MADLWMDVDTALSEVPINIMPLTDDTDFKTREESVVYNQAGLDLVWNFVTTAGAMSQTAVTPTDTAGDYDWVNQGNGMYSIEIPASGGASINNDTEGFGWFTGFATGILPWRGPIIGFRAAALNNSLIDAGTTGLLAPTVAARTLDVTATGAAGIDWGNVENPTTAVDLSATDIQLVDTATAVTNDVGVNEWNGVALATTNPLPNAAPDAAGGLVISDAGGLDIDTMNNNVSSILTDTGTTIPATLGTPTDLGGGATLADNNADMAGATFSSTTDSQEAIRDRGDAAWTTGSGSGLSPLATGTAQGGTASTIQLAAGETFADDELNGNIVKITGGTGAGQARLIADYTGATDTASITPNWATNPDATSTYEVVEGPFVLSDGTPFQGADIAAILLDTAEIGAAGAGLTEAGGTGDHLTAIDLPDQTMNITGNLTGNLVGNVTGNINTAAGTIQTLDALDTAQDTQHATTLSKLLKYVQLILRKDSAIATDNATELTAINANGGSGAGAFDNTTDSQEGIRDNQQTAAAAALTAYDPPTNAEMEARTLAAAAYFDPAADTVAHVTLVDTTTTNTDMRGTDSAATAANLATAQADLDTLTGTDGATLATSQPNYTPSTHSAADVWAVATRVLTAGTNLNDISVADILTTAMTESYAADGVAPTLTQALFLIQQMLTEFAISSTTLTAKKLDGSTTAATFTLDDDTNPTSITRAT